MLDGAGPAARRLTRQQAAQMQQQVAKAEAAAIPKQQQQQKRRLRCRRAQNAPASTPPAAAAAPAAGAAAAVADAGPSSKSRKRRRVGGDDVGGDAGAAAAAAADADATPAHAADQAARLTGRTLVDAVLAHPQSPESVRIAAGLLRAAAASPLLSQPYWKAVGAVLRLAKQAPQVLLGALAVEGRPLQAVLQSLHCGNALIGHSAALCIANLAKTATDNQGSSTAQLAAGLMAALLADEQCGLMLLLRGLSACSDNIAAAVASAVAFLARPAAVPLPEGVQSSAAMLLQGLLQQPQGLQLLLVALDTAKTADAAVFTLRSLAQVEPVQLLEALLQPCQRRGLQHLLRALCSGSERTASKAYDGLLQMAQAASQQQLAALMHHLLRSMRQGSLGAARVVWAVSQTQTGQAVLLQFVQQLMQMLGQPGQPCQAAAAAALWHVAESHNGSLALAQQNLSPLLGAMLVGGEVAVMAACIVCFLTLTEAALHQLGPHVPQLLHAAQPQHPAPVVSMAIRSVFCISTTGGPAGLRQVLEHAGSVIQVMQQQQHPDAAAVAGNTVLQLLQSEEGKACLSQEQHIDGLLEVLRLRAPAMVHASRALAHIASTTQAGKMALLQPHRLAVLHGMHTLLPGLEAAADAAAYEAFAPLFWVSVAAGALEVVPTFIGKLVRAMQLTHLTMPCFDALTHMTSFRGGLLALAPYLPDITASLAACVAANQLLINEAALQQYLRWMIGKVEQAIQELRSHQEAAQACLHLSAVRLSQLRMCESADDGGCSSRTRQRRRLQPPPPSRAQGVLLTLLLKRFLAVHELHQHLLWQLQVAQGPPRFDD